MKTRRKQPPFGRGDISRMFFSPKVNVTHFTTFLASVQRRHGVCVLIVYPTTSLTHRSVLTVVRGIFAPYRIASPGNRSFYFSFARCNAFDFFLGTKCSGRDSQHYVRTSGESGHPRLAPDFRKKAFRFLPLSMMRAVGFHIGPLLC